VKKLVVAVLVIVALALGWYWYCGYSEAEWQKWFASQRGKFSEDGYSPFHYEVSPDPAETGKWRVSVWTLGDFARRDCRGFATNHQAVETAESVIKDYKRGEIEPEDWLRLDKDSD